MSDVSYLAVQMLKDGRRAVAELVCSRLIGESGQGQMICHKGSSSDRLSYVESLLDVLASCIRLSSRVLWDNYVHWLNSLPRAVSPLYGCVPTVLENLVDVVNAEFPHEASQLITNYLAVDDQADRNPTTDKIEPFGLGQPIGPAKPARHSDYLAALLATRRNEALNIILDAVNLGMSIESVYLDILQPAQHELGQLWQTGQISVAQEHYCTAATQFIMSQLQPYFLSAQPSDMTLVATCVGDELHEVGLRIVTDLFEVQGWNTIYLGANTPAQSIAEAVASNNAQVLALSVTMSQHLLAAVDVIQAVRSHPACQLVKVLVGGNPFNIDPGLWKRIGADACARDGQEAIRVVQRLSDRVGAFRDGEPLVAVNKVDAPLAGSQTPDDLSRLNNNLITLQRELHKANLQLAASSKANYEKSVALEQADRRKDEFLAMLAHELRGPLAPIEFALALLEMENIDPAVVQESRETIKRQLRQMKRLISDLLDASRIAHGKIELQSETLELKGVVECAIQIATPLIQEKQQSLVLDYADAPITIDGDEVRLIQVFANLLTNASKYTQPQGTIRLSTQRIDDAAVVRVNDNGLGIEEDYLPQMFATFAQEPRSRQHSRGGLGLGLSLVKQLVELHAGHVAVESGGAGQGSTFTVTLPCLTTEQAEPDPDKEACLPAEGDGPARRVLIVEDTAGIARITALLFKQLGHLPEIARDGATALAKVRQSTPEIVVLDLELPDMSGLDVAREIRRLDSSNSILIVALTGHQDAQHRALAQQSGCDEYFVKPVVVKRLRELAKHPKLMTTY